MATTTSQHRPKGLLSKNSTKNPIRFPLLPNGNNTTSNNNITTNKSTNKSTNKDSSYEYGNILAGSKKRLGKTKINIVEKKDLLVTGIGTIQPTKTYPKDEPFQHEEAPIYSKALLQVIKRQRIYHYLKTNPDFLKEYIMDHVEENEIKYWLSSKSVPSQPFAEEKADPEFEEAGSRRAKELEEEMMKNRDNLHEGLQKIGKRHNLYLILYCMMRNIGRVINATRSRLYIVDENGEVVYQFIPQDPSNVKSKRQRLAGQDTPIATAIRTKTAVRLNAMREDFARKFTEYRENVEIEYDFSLWQPIMTFSGEVFAVMEISKFKGIGFTYEDAHAMTSLALWCQLTLERAMNLYSQGTDKDIYQMMNAIVKSMSQDVMSVKKVTTLILTQTKQFIKADRASIFVYSSKNDDEVELYPLVFDVGYENKDKNTRKFKSILRFPSDKGIVGHCGKIGKSIIVNHASDDDRFYRNVDKVTGYKSKNMICTPILNNGSVIGIIQMINKINESTFTCLDKRILENVSLVCGLALHYAKLYDKVRKLDYRYMITLDVAAYHRCASIEEAADILGKPRLDTSGIINYSMDTKGLPKSDVPRYVLAMFRDVFEMTKVMKGGQIKFNEETLIRFTLTVRNNYRNVPYHNWNHAFQVAHSFYTVIKTCPDVLSPIERLALFVGCLCHDLDHRAKTNAYMVNSKNPLAAMYSTSTMEYHHFYTAMSILRADGHNVFEFLPKDLYEKAIQDMKQAIVYTDLALFFSNRAILQKIINENKFSWNNPEHIMRLKGIIMTACDLSAVIKPWHINRLTVRQLFQEFYNQGDEEKAQSRNPLPMMDREKAHDLPANQVGFIMGICLPCYEILARILPNTYPMLDGTRSNLQNWSALVAKQKAEKDELEALQKANEEGEIYEPKYRKDKLRTSHSSTANSAKVSSGSKDSIADNK